jgi:hypothetical protein
VQVIADRHRAVPKSVDFLHRPMIVLKVPGHQPAAFGAQIEREENRGMLHPRHP